MNEITASKIKIFCWCGNKASRKGNYNILKEETDALKEMAWSDVQIIEAVAIMGYLAGNNYINTLSNVFALAE